MRPLKVISLLFSLGQLLLILKLIEYVRGVPLQPEYYGKDLLSNNNNNTQEEQRGFIFSSKSKKKQKIYRPWTGDSSAEDITTTIFPEELFDGDNYNVSSINMDRMDMDVENSTIIQGGNEEGRLCPGCIGTCGQSNVTGYGFPVIPVVISIIVGVAWFFVFLWLWYYATVPVKSSGGYGRSMDNINELTSLLSDSLSVLSKHYSPIPTS